MEKDVLQTLTENHAVLGWLAQRLALATPARSRSLLFTEFSRALGAHQTVMDRTVMPGLKACGWSGVSSDVLTGHASLKRALAESLTLDRNEFRFEEAVRQLVRQVQVQCEREQRQLLPVLRRCLDGEQRAMMALDAEAHMTLLLGETPHFQEAMGLTQLAADDLIREAYVVLGSLPARATPPQMEH